MLSLQKDLDQQTPRASLHRTLDSFSSPKVAELDRTYLDSASRKALHLFFLPGITAVPENMQLIRSELADRFNPENITVESSSFSSEWARPDRFKKLSESFTQQLQENKHVILVAHSMGAPELTYLIKAIEKSSPGLLEQHANKIHLVMISPAGFIRTAKELPDFFKRVYKTFAFSKEGKNTADNFRGIESFTVVPHPELSPQKLQQGFLHAFAELQLKITDALVLTQESEHPDPRNYPDFLDKTEQLLLNNIDVRIGVAFRQDDWNTFRQFVIKRGVFLAQKIEATYQGKLLQRESANAAQAPREASLPLSVKDAAKVYAQALLGLGRMLRYTFSGEVRHTISKLYKTGVDLKYIFPEYDGLVSAETIIEFWQDHKDEPEDLKKALAEQNIGIGASAHSTFALGPKVLGEILSRLATQIIDNEKT